MDLKQTEWQHKMALNLSSLWTSGEFLWIHNEASSAIKGRQNSMTNECVCACQGLLSEDSVSITHLCSDDVGITCLCCDCQHSIWTFSQPCYWTFRFSGMLWSAIGYAVPSVWRFVVPSKYGNYTLYDKASHFKRLLIFNVA